MDAQATQGAQEVGSAVQSNAGWMAAAALGVWGWFVRMALGRHLKSADDDREEFREFMSDVRERLGRIEGRFQERDHS